MPRYIGLLFSSYVCCTADNLWAEYNGSLTQAYFTPQPLTLPVWWSLHSRHYYFPPRLLIYIVLHIILAHQHNKNDVVSIVHFSLKNESSRLTENFLWRSKLGHSLKYAFFRLGLNVSLLMKSKKCVYVIGLLMLIYHLSSTPIKLNWILILGAVYCYIYVAACLQLQTGIDHICAGSPRGNLIKFAQGKYPIIRCQVAPTYPVLAHHNRHGHR